MNRGIWYAVGAYVCWGLFPVYWKLLQHVPAVQLIGHRIIWSCVILSCAITFSRQWGAFRNKALRWSALPIYLGAALLLSVNWLVYVWAVNAGFIVETSLGYFINPLISVVMGVLFLREHLRRWQWVAVALAAAGVVYLTYTYGSLPWIALTLAFTFAAYGLAKKMAPLGALYGLTLETGLLALPALIYLFYADRVGTGAFLRGNTLSDLLMVGAGAVTTVPLLMFASAARRIPLSLVGIIQYMAPTLQFLIGIIVYGESFTRSRAIGFGVVWAALAIFWVEGLLAVRRRPLRPTSRQHVPSGTPFN